MPIYALAAGLAVGFAVLVFARPYVGLLALVACMSWEDLLDYPSDTITVVKIVGALLFASWFLHALVVGQPLRSSPSFVAAYLFFLLATISLATSPVPGVGAAKVLRYCLWLVFLFLMLQLIDTVPDVLRLLRVYTASAAAAAAYALVDFVLHDTARASGPIHEPNVFAFVLLIALVFAGYLAFNASRRGRLLWAASFVVILAATMATLSRAALVGLAAVVLWALLSGRLRLTRLVSAAVALGLVAVVGFTLIPSLLNERLQEKRNISGANTAARLTYWSAAERMALDHPILGVGPGRFGDEVENYVLNNPVSIERPVAHNAYLEILAENGLLAAAAFMAILVLAWRDLQTARRGAALRGPPELLGLVSTVQGALVAVIVAGFFGSEQTSPPYWLLAGIAAILARQVRVPDETIGTT
jgi:O-antigen ligase